MTFSSCPSPPLALLRPTESSLDDLAETEQLVFPEAPRRDDLQDDGRVGECLGRVCERRGAGVSELSPSAHRREGERRTHSYPS